MKRTFAVALGGMVAAASVILMLMTGLFPFATLALPALAGALLLASVLETGPLWAIAVYAAVGILSLLVAPDREAAVYYILLFGHYPIVKNFIERIRLRPVQWVLKIAAFNLCGVAAYLISLKLLGVRDDLIKYGYPLAFAAANITFILYDFALTRLIVTYTVRIRKKIKRP